MSLNLHWFLPTAGDSRDVAGWGATSAQRDVTLDYLTQVAKAPPSRRHSSVGSDVGETSAPSTSSRAARVRSRSTR